MRTRLKICCISSRAEASLAIEVGASAIGLVSAMPSGPGVIPDTLITELAALAPIGVAAVLLNATAPAMRAAVNVIETVSYGLIILIGLAG